MRSPRVVPRLPSVLTVLEVEGLLQQPNPSRPLGIRDRAMLELMYATGLRVSELVHLTVNDVNLDVGYVRTRGKGSKERIVPIGKAAGQALKGYLEGPRRLHPLPVLPAHVVRWNERKGNHPPGFLEDLEEVCPDRRDS